MTSPATGSRPPPSELPDARETPAPSSTSTSTSPEEQPPPVIPSITPRTRTRDGASTVRTCWWTVTGRKIDRGALDERPPSDPGHEEPHRTAQAGLPSRGTMAGRFQAGGALWRATGGGTAGGAISRLRSESCSTATAAQSAGKVAG